MLRYFRIDKSLLLYREMIIMAFINELYYQRNLVALTLANAFEGSGWYYDEKSKNKKQKE